MNRCAAIRMIEALAVTPERVPRTAPIDRAYTPTALDLSEAMRHAMDPAADLPSSFVEEACARGDRCFAVLHGGSLASYAWCSALPTPLDESLVVSVPPAWMYTYKAFTLPAHRGARLHGMLTALIVDDAARRSYRGLMACVDADNFRSLRSFTRVGAVHAGVIGAIRWFGAVRVLLSPGCRARGLRVTAVR
ncbi:MAG: hypothetical protein IT176_03510 [Acidobacteria bacterium]|nr:hypothetical protein [Acidobacteriota bacterium]